MRDRSRIGPILETLRVLWVLQPDTRLCQLLSNIAFKNGWMDNDLFYLEDDQLIEALEAEMAAITGDKPV